MQKIVWKAAEDTLGYASATADLGSGCFAILWQYPITLSENSDYGRYYEYQLGFNVNGQWYRSDRFVPPGRTAPIAEATARVKAFLTLAARAMEAPGSRS